MKGLKTIWLAAVLAFVLFSPALSFVLAEQPQPVQWSRDLVLFVGNVFVVKSDQSSIQQVFLQGNLTAANYTKSDYYPIDEFTLTTSNPGTYNLRVLFDLKTGYSVNMYVRSTYINNTASYLSGGPSELDVKVSFSSQPFQALAIAHPAGGGFANWVTKFGQAFPFWVKLLYLTFGLQFFVVGGLWIQRESTRRESSQHALDTGEKAFLWLDIVYKFLLTSLIVLVALMGGEFVILFLLRFMFLVSLDLLSLWDIFVLGFALGLVIIFYMIRFTFEKVLDLKPLEDE